MTTPQTPADADERRDAFIKARSAARNAVLALVRSEQTAARDIEPLVGLRAARQLELGARDVARTHIRAAREAGHTWHDIGAAMHLVPGADPQQAGDTVAEAAYTYAAGNSDTDSARRYGRSVAWTCLTCDTVIFDRGPDNGPADDERGHARNCQRLVANINAWNAQWEAEP